MGFHDKFYVSVILGKVERKRHVGKFMRNSSLTLVVCQSAIANLVSPGRLARLWVESLEARNRCRKQHQIHDIRQSCRTDVVNNIRYMKFCNRNDSIRDEISNMFSLDFSVLLGLSVSLAFASANLYLWFKVSFSLSYLIP